MPKSTSSFPPVRVHNAKQDQNATRTRPSDLILEVTRGGGGTGADACSTPRIVEFLNLEDNTAAITSAVRLDEPLFQPYPSKIVLEGYEAFGRQQKVLPSWVGLGLVGLGWFGWG